MTFLADLPEVSAVAGYLARFKGQSRVHTDLNDRVDQGETRGPLGAWH